MVVYGGRHTCMIAMWATHMVSTYVVGCTCITAMAVTLDLTAASLGADDEDEVDVELALYLSCSCCIDDDDMRTDRVTDEDECEGDRPCTL